MYNDRAGLGLASELDLDFELRPGFNGDLEDMMQTLHSITKERIYREKIELATVNIRYYAQKRDEEECF